MLSPVRAGIVVLFVLAIANGGFLYFFPSRAEPDYAWAIASPVSAGLMGAGYLAGAVAGGLALFAARYWRSVRALVPGFLVLGLTLLLATLIDADRFRWDYPPTWLWTAVYAGLPFAAAYLWLLQERVASEQPERDARLAPLRALSWPLGLVLGIVGLVLFVAPDSLLDEWPWDITPLIARVFGGWYLLAATTLVMSASSARRPHEIPIPYATIATWSLLILLLPLLYPDSVRTNEPGFWIWIGTHAAVLAGCSLAIMRSAALLRANAERL
jgi:hypothetical protein